MSLPGMKRLNLEKSCSQMHHGNLLTQYPFNYKLLIANYQCYKFVLAFLYKKNVSLITWLMGLGSVHFNDNKWTKFMNVFCGEYNKPVVGYEKINKIFIGMDKIFLISPNFGADITLVWLIGSG